MPKSNETLTRHNICLYPGDYSRLRQLRGKLAAAIIRDLVRKYIRRYESDLPPDERILEDD